MELTTSTPLNIVLVEDNPDDEELMLEALKEYRLRNPVIVLRDGQQAIDYFFRQGAYTEHSSKQPDLILLDIKLPKVDGLDVLAKIKSDDELKRIPVVVLTSSKEDRDIARGYELGANSYIVKPIDFEQLLETVRTIGGYWLIVNEPAPNK
ncbi:MAG: response regulator [Chloroflexota bacterium]